MVDETARIVGEMLIRALQSEDFKQMALRDFAAAYKDHTKKDWKGPNHFRIVESGQGDISQGLFEIPSIENELNDDDLEKVAGGYLSAIAPVLALAQSVLVYAVGIPPASGSDK